MADEGSKVNARHVIDRVRAARKAIATRCAWWCAPYYRQLLSGTRFIGITGSGGKTTTKDLAFEVLRSRFRVHKNEGSQNAADIVAKTLLVR